MENTSDTPSFYKCMHVGLLGHTCKQKTRIPLPKVSKRLLIAADKEARWVGLVVPAPANGSSHPSPNMST